MGDERVAGSGDRRTLTAVVCVPRSCAQPSACRRTDSSYHFNYNVDATTHLKKLDQTIAIKGRKFVGGIDFATGDRGQTLTFTFSAAGNLPPPVTGDKIVLTKPYGTDQSSVTTSLSLRERPR